MLPSLVLVGRPNVGKSTLFNRLTQSRDALVADFPGLTRDRHFGRGRGADRPYLVVDTGGFEPKVKSGIMHAMAKQTRQAIAESDAVVFLVDGREGLTAQDSNIADLLRRSGRPVVLAVNKAEGIAPERVTAEFHELALGTPLPISSAHGENVRDLVNIALALCPAESADDPADAAGGDDGSRIKVAVVGRPNVGKSTLVNTLLGEERVIAFDEPGTTRDALYLDFDRDGRHYTLIDTAGVRRRGKVFEAIEKFSVIKTLQAIEDANVVVLLLDAQAEISEQDAHIAGHILDAGRALVVAVNKWDDIGTEERAEIKRELGQRHRAAVALGRRRVCGGNVQAADTQAHPRARRRRGATAAAARRDGAAEAALCPPGRNESAGDRDPRIGAGSHPADLPPLSGTFLCRRVPTAGNAA